MRGGKGTPYTPRELAKFANQLPPPSTTTRAEIESGAIDFTQMFNDEGGVPINLNLFEADEAADDEAADDLTSGPQGGIASQFPWRTGGCSQCRYSKRGCRGKKEYPCGGPTWKTVREWKSMTDADRVALFDDFNKLK